MAVPAWSWVPSPVASTSAVMQNLMDVAGELERRDLTGGGVVSQNLILSSSTRIDGDTTFNGPVMATYTLTVGGALTASTATLSGNLTLNGSTTSSRGYLVLGDPTASMARGVGGLAVYAKSVDNITLSSGCLVILGSGRTTAAEAVPADPSVLVFTSTTTQAVAGQYGILLDDSCAPSTVCAIAVWGVARMVSEAAVPVAGIITMGTTRCRGYNSSDNLSNSSAGTPLSATTGNGQWFWIFLGGR